MVKKFSFNFKFLDRFKKKSSEVDSSNQKKNLSFDTLPDNDDQETYDSDESPEEFAEKTLGGFNLKKFKEFENNYEPIDSSESTDDEPEADITEDESDNTETSSSSEDEHLNSNEESSPNFQFSEIPLPSKPEAAKKFRFKFPSFNSESAKINIQKRFSQKPQLPNFEKITWNDFILKLFSPYSRTKVHSVFIILLVATATYMLGKNLALIFNKPPTVSKSFKTIQVPMEKVDTTAQDINKIASTNLFNLKESDKAVDNKPKKDIDSIVCLDADRPTASQIKLLDTIVLQDSVKSVASVQVRGSADLQNVREGEKLEDVEISKINRMKIILKNLQTGECEYAATENDDTSIMPPLKIVSAKVGKSLFKSSNPSIKNVGNSFKIKKTFRDSMVTNMSDVLTQAKAVQITNPDGSLCFKMTEVMAGSLYTQLNIQENDIVCQINGRKIENLNELMGLLGRIKEIDQFQIGLKRNGMNENLEYGFE